MLFRPGPLGDAELAVLNDIETLRVQLRPNLSEPRRWFGSLRRISFARNVQGSNSIEGYSANLDDALAVIDREEPSEAASETRLALEGYRNAMTYVLQMCSDSGRFEYSTGLLRSLHFMMTGFDLKNRPGMWRAGAIYVRDGAAGATVYEGPDVDLVPELIDELVASLNQADCNPIVAGAIAHLNLVMIHPFRDGNGRMARCLQSLVIGRSGDTLSPVFSSVEEYLGRNTTAYYKVLAETGQGAWNPDRDTTNWVRFMLTAHLRQARTYRQRLRDYEHLWVDLVALLGDGDEDRQLPALMDAAVGLRITRGGYVKILAANGEEISDQSATRDLRELVDRGLLVPQGEKRARIYLGSDRLRVIWEKIREGRPGKDNSDPLDHLVFETLTLEPTFSPSGSPQKI